MAPEKHSGSKKKIMLDTEVWARLHDLTRILRHMSEKERRDISFQTLVTQVRAECSKSFPIKY